ncbi:hypothetical protein FOZ60_001489 [Perkinsus olseni]|uniref:MULE transposase domain-containing protein n=1 Tax=Perkinsus olseni TaxID=32597 RepID=A0A7J6P2R3_PEROL|nr:hypothetical protein FOZ60_001489 [Perkinsus olseni]
MASNSTGQATEATYASYVPTDEALQRAANALLQAMLRERNANEGHSQPALQQSTPRDQNNRPVEAPRKPKSKYVTSPSLVFDTLDDAKRALNMCAGFGGDGCQGAMTLDNYYSRIKINDMVHWYRCPYRGGRRTGWKSCNYSGQIVATSDGKYVVNKLASGHLDHVPDGRPKPLNHGLDKEIRNVIDEGVLQGVPACQSIDRCREKGLALPTEKFRQQVYKRRHTVRTAENIDRPRPGPTKMEMSAFCEKHKKMPLNHHGILCLDYNFADTDASRKDFFCFFTTPSLLQRNSVRGLFVCDYTYKASWLSVPILLGSIREPTSFSLVAVELTAREDSLAAKRLFSSVKKWSAEVLPQEQGGCQPWGLLSDADESLSAGFRAVYGETHPTGLDKRMRLPEDRQAASTHRFYCYVHMLRATYKLFQKTIPNPKSPENKDVWRRFRGALSVAQMSPTPEIFCVVIKLIIKEWESLGDFIKLWVRRWVRRRGNWYQSAGRKEGFYPRTNNATEATNRSFRQGKLPHQATVKIRAEPVNCVR